MNFTWIAFPISDNGSIGNVALNIVRLLAVIIAIILVVVHKKRCKEPYFVNKITLWVNKGK